MVKCPNCGSTAQVKYLKSTFEEDGDSICAIRKYKCGCGETFKTAKLYVPSELDHEDIIDSWRNKEE